MLMVKQIFYTAMLCIIVIGCSNNDVSMRKLQQRKVVASFDSCLSKDNQNVTALVPHKWIAFPVRELSNARRLERYVSSVVSDSSIVMRIVNESDERVERYTKYIWHGDTVETRPRDTIVFANVVWIVQNHPDSLRFIFTRNVNDPSDTSIVDITVPYARGVSKRIEQWSELDSAKLLASKQETMESGKWYSFVTFIVDFPPGVKRIVLRPVLKQSSGWFLSTVFYWSRRAHFYIALGHLYHPYLCKTGVGEANFPESYLVRDVVGLLCTAKGIGAFEDAFTVPYFLVEDERGTKERRIE